MEYVNSQIRNTNRENGQGKATNLLWSVILEAPIHIEGREKNDRNLGRMRKI